jgi:hypothetical protein
MKKLPYKYRNENIIFANNFHYFLENFSIFLEPTELLSVCFSRWLEWVHLHYFSKIIVLVGQICRHGSNFLWCVALASTHDFSIISSNARVMQFLFSNLWIIHLVLTLRVSSNGLAQASGWRPQRWVSQSKPISHQQNINSS